MTIGFYLNVTRPGDWTGNQHMVATVDGCYHVAKANNPMWRNYAASGQDAPTASTMRDRAEAAGVLMVAG
jgi:hypothetical protein